MQEKSIPDEDAGVTEEAPAEEEAPVPEVVNEVPDPSQLAVESNAKLRNCQRSHMHLL